MTSPWVEALSRGLPTGRVVTDPDVVAAHARDHAGLVQVGTAGCLVRARSVDDVVATLEVAER